MILKVNSSIYNVNDKLLLEKLVIFKDGIIRYNLPSTYVLLDNIGLGGWLHCVRVRRPLTCTFFEHLFRVAT